MLNRQEIDQLVADHKKEPHQRLLQKRLAEEVTVLVHSREDYDMAVEASGILFGKATAESLSRIPEEMFLAVFEGVPQFKISFEQMESGIMKLLVDDTSVFQSKGELRRLIQGGGVSMNKQKITDPEATVSASDFINGKYLLVQKGKKNYFLIRVQ